MESQDAEGASGLGTLRDTDTGRRDRGRPSRHGLHATPRDRGSAAQDWRRVRLRGRPGGSRDPWSAAYCDNPSHGTSTSSLIFSAQGPPAGWAGPAFVSGTAPGASLIPIRTTKSVVLWSMSRLTRAIHYAVEHGAHVISISLGGPVPSTALHNAVREAESQGVIVLCAAGNQVRFVVFPAAFDEVIAVAASRIDDEPWDGSCRGPAVDITAPGSSVWRARTVLHEGVEQYKVLRGSGTSYAVAPTAGIAALWLSYHGRGALVARYGKDRVAAVFKLLLQQTCRTPQGWDTRDFGPGHRECVRVARCAIAGGCPGAWVEKPSATRRIGRSGRAGIARSPAGARAAVGRGCALAELLRVDESALPEALDDVGAELAMAVGTDPVLRQQLRDASMSFAGRGPRRAVRSVRTGAGRATLKGGSKRIRSYLSGAVGRPKGRHPLAASASPSGRLGDRGRRRSAAPRRWSTSRSPSREHPRTTADEGSAAVDGWT